MVIINNIRFDSWPTYSKKEISLVNKVIKSGKVNYWTGKYCSLFEKSFAKKIKIKYAISLANGSLALDAAIYALKLNDGDEVIVTARSYVTSASCILRAQKKVKVIFADVNFNTQNIDLCEIKKLVNIKTKAIICVHHAGMPCDMEKIIEFTKKKNIKIIEDCSQAHGAKIGKKYAGSFGDISIWSFCNDKIISTLGEGGMIATSNYNFMKTLFSYKDCGRNLDKVIKIKKNYHFKYIHDFPGTNMRMTEVQAAVGYLQLKKLDKTLMLRNKNCKKIWNAIEGSKYLYAPKIKNNIFHAGYRCYLYAKTKKLRDSYLHLLNRFKIQAAQGTCPEIYREKLFMGNSNILKNDSLKNARNLGNLCFTLPTHNNISSFNINYIIKTLKHIEKIIEKI